MEMVSSKLYWVKKSIFKLYGRREEGRCAQDLE
jgi:hypothetical protein